MGEVIRVVGVFVINDRNDVLLVRENKYDFRGLEKIITGHVEPGEDPAVAAVREVGEEGRYSVAWIELFDQYEYPGQ